MRETFTPVERQDAMNQAIAQLRILPLSSLVGGAPAGRHPVALLLGLAAIILGILGMHILGVSHQMPAATPHVAMVPDTAGTAVASPRHATSQDHSPAVADALSWTGADQIPADACAGPCGSEQHLMAAMCVLMVIILATLWFIPKLRFLKAFHGLRAPPAMPAPATRLPWTPSLIELSISRT